MTYMTTTVLSRKPHNYVLVYTPTMHGENIVSISTITKHNHSIASLILLLYLLDCHHEWWTQKLDIKKMRYISYNNTQEHVYCVQVQYTCMHVVKIFVSSYRTNCSGVIWLTKWNKNNLQCAREWLHFTYTCSHVPTP